MFMGHLGINLGGLKRNVLLSVTDAADWLEQLPPPPGAGPTAPGPHVSRPLPSACC